MKPWWLPDNWLDVGLAIVGVACAVQVWKLHCRYRYGRKPPRYVIAAVSSVATGAFLTLLCWLDDQPLKHSIRLGLMWGSSAPALWVGIQMAVLKWAPWLSPAVGACRRQSQRDETWTPERRRELFEDTVEMPTVKRPDKLNGQGGFMSITLLVGVVGALLAGALVIQSLRLGNAQEALGMERVAKSMAMARVKRLGQEKQAVEASLAHRDRAYEAIRKQSVEARQKLAEVERDPESRDWLDRPVPDAIRVLVRGGGGHPNTKAIHEPAAPHPGAGGNGEGEPRPADSAGSVGG